MKNKLELLAPGGDIDAIKAAILAGADAIYCGLDKFNARNRAGKISFDDLQGIIHLAHKNDCEVFLTLNIIILENEISAFINLLNKLVNTNIDGIILQDLGMIYLVSKYFKSLKIHISTQLTTHNEGQILFLNEFNIQRVNLSRELNIHEIKDLSSISRKENILTEVFVHGSYCISFSGACYISSVQSGNSGNRGRCSQPCRDKYEKTAAGKDYPLNLKDNSNYFELEELANAGVYSLKIEGRIKKSDYVYTIVHSWKQQIMNYYKGNKLSADNSILYKVFNRDFTNSYLKGNINKDMFIDNPRDYSIKHLSDLNDFSSEKEKEKAELKLYSEKEEIKTSVRSKINTLNAKKAALTIKISGQEGEVLEILVKTPETSFLVFSKVNLIKKEKDFLDSKMILKRFKALNETEYFIEKLDLENLPSHLFIPFKELTALKNRLLFLLNDSKELIKPVQIPSLKKKNTQEIKPSLSVLISSKEDMKIYKESSARIYFQLPSNFTNRLDEFVELFTENKNIIPWFPSILMGEDYHNAVEFLHKIEAEIIVSNNTGIAYEAYKKGIKWIAGPFLNTSNSYSLLSLKEKFKCSGAFISNELNKNQIKAIQKPDDFELFYSIYHPIPLMTTRVCLFHQITSCEKNRVDNSCIEKCTKTASISNLKKETLFVEKTPGNYHHIYNSENFLNSDIITDIPNVFSSFFIDLREVKTETKIDVSKTEIIDYFQSILNGNSEEEIIHSTTKKQYKKGIF